MADLRSSPAFMQSVAAARAELPEAHALVARQPPTHTASGRVSRPTKFHD
jgi:hypothetical protein